MSQNLQFAIYKIESSETLDSLSEKAAAKNFIAQLLVAESKDGFQVKLYYQIKSSNPKWKGFIESVSATGAEILQPHKSRIEGFVLFLAKNDRIYAVTGGHGHFVIQDCVDKDFGIDVFSRLVKKEDM